ncbi:HAD-superfamily hydrolase [Baekduia alba]|uniref:HAD family hydrolase n=1 Tax=Baekduia alba TaxID=2997333 RepID=UPI00233FB89A|nr:HAD hydrolase-like protein [Baekduia alba]WCB95715.1 HAD-superfamily hydrolase [Baekduia alba]
MCFTFIAEVEPLRGARALLQDLHVRGRKVVLASSAKADEVDHHLDLLDARSLADGWTTSADVQATKPDPDLVLAAMDQLGDDGKNGIMIGDLRTRLDDTPLGYGEGMTVLEVPQPTEPATPIVPEPSPVPADPEPPVEPGTPGGPVGPDVPEPDTPREDPIEPPAPAEGPGA